MPKKQIEKIEPEKILKESKGVGTLISAIIKKQDEIIDHLNSQEEEE